MELNNNSDELKINVVEPVEEPDLLNDRVESASSSDFELAVTRPEKLKQMHKDVKKILRKARNTKDHLKVLKQEAENSYESLKNNLEPSQEVKISDLSNISIQNSNTLWDELKLAEAQLNSLKEKIRSSEQFLSLQKKTKSEIKQLIHDIQSNKSNSSMKSSCTTCILH